ncbi:DNA-3-methyladenine glycosylase 2 family protein [Streptomyces sp. NPDC049916]|uniref:DNA-3-methyladenine glycosylase family protein n=1 Tax=Streptomyces sp. NPDC049916 TaxID=3155156 RepID=UPI0034155154
MSFREWVAPSPYDLARTLRTLRRGQADPTFRRADDGSWWRTLRSPAGPATLRIHSRTENGVQVVTGQAWGPGTDWALHALPDLLGADDDPAQFTARHRAVAVAQRAHRGVRLARTGLVMESLIPAVLEQRITTGSAHAAWRRLVQLYGEDAPGPAPEGMRVMPAPNVWRMIPSWEWHRANVDRSRAAAIVRACQRAARLEEAAAMELPAAMARIQLIEGIGPWTAAETLQRALGAPDALTLGDLHLPVQITYALTGERGGTDARMLELLAPYAGQRHRAARYLLLGGRLPNRRAHRAPHSRIAHL